MRRLKHKTPHRTLPLRHERESRHLRNCRLRLPPVPQGREMRLRDDPSQTTQNLEKGGFRFCDQIMAIFTGDYSMIAKERLAFSGGTDKVSTLWRVEVLKSGPLKKGRLREFYSTNQQPVLTRTLWTPPQVAKHSANY